MTKERLTLFTIGLIMSLMAWGGSSILGNSEDISKNSQGVATLENDKKYIIKSLDSLHNKMDKMSEKQ